MFPSVAVFAILMSSVLLLDASCAFAYVICLLLASVSFITVDRSLFLFLLYPLGHCSHFTSYFTA